MKKKVKRDINDTQHTHLYSSQNGINDIRYIQIDNRMNLHRVVLSKIGQQMKQKNGTNKTTISTMKGRMGCERINQPTMKAAVK